MFGGSVVESDKVDMWRDPGHQTDIQQLSVAQMV